MSQVSTKRLTVGTLLQISGVKIAKPSTLETTQSNQPHFVAYCPSEFGWWRITGTEKGIQRLQLTKETPPAAHSDAKLPSALTACVQQLQEYFQHRRKTFDVSLDLTDASPFYQKVWKALLAIPYGQTASYSSIANKIGQPKAVRAIGLANRNNPIAIIIPCHRVLAKNGELWGYFYGLEVKRKLLALENPMAFAPQGKLF